MLLPSGELRGQYGLGDADVPTAGIGRFRAASPLVLLVAHLAVVLHCRGGVYSCAEAGLRRVRTRRQLSRRATTTRWRAGPIASHCRPNDGPKRVLGRIRLWADSAFALRSKAPSGAGVALHAAGPSACDGGASRGSQRGTPT